MDAVAATAWMGLLTMGLMLPLAFIWAFIPIRFGGNAKAKNHTFSAGQRPEIEARLAALESVVNEWKNSPRQ